jgi:hypothetical protein
MRVGGEDEDEWDIIALTPTHPTLNILFLLLDRIFYALDCIIEKDYVYHRIRKNDSLNHETLPFYQM